jgi:putative ABC transport system permease protein
VAIARALAGQPDLILADEPTGNLDEATGDAVLELLIELVAETGAAMLMVTHSERLAGASRGASPCRAGGWWRDGMGPALLSLLSHWRRNPVQLAMLWLGLALATALWSGVQAINARRGRAMTPPPRRWGRTGWRGWSGAMAGLLPGGLRGAPACGLPVSPVITGEVRDAAGGLRLIGIDPFTAPEAGTRHTRQWRRGGGGVSGGGRPPADVGATANGRLPAGLPPIAILDTVPPAAAITDIATAARLLGPDRPRLPDRRAGPARRPAPAEPATTPAAGTADAAGDVARLTDSFHLNLTAFGLLSFGVGLFIVHAAIGLAFEQRRAVFRTLRAVGLPLRTLMARWRSRSRSWRSSRAPSASRWATPSRRR